ncbi:MAG: hypothetical protein ACYDBB_20665 [Armatimonadota bacterium]
MSRTAWSLVMVLFFGCMPGGWCAPAPQELFPVKGPINAVKSLPRASWAFFPSCDGTGRYLIFNSMDNPNVPKDTNGFFDLIVYDLQTDELRKVTVSSKGAESDGNTFAGCLSHDGRYAVFGTVASNLVPGDTNKVSDVFLRDRKTGTTTRVSVGSTGQQTNGPSFSGDISDDGRYLAFTSQASNLGGANTTQFRIFLRDLQTGETTYVGRGHGVIHISGDGNYVLFGFINESYGVYRYNRNTKETERVDVSTEKVEANMSPSWAYDISDDGRYVAFASQAYNLVPEDTNKKIDVFVRDMEKKTTTRVSCAADGTEGNGDSGYDVNGSISGLSISGDGRWVVFASTAENLVPNDTNRRGDIFVYDVLSEKLSCASIDAKGKPSGGMMPSVNDDGSYIFFLGNGMNVLIRKPLPPVTPPISRVPDMPGYERITCTIDGTAVNGETAALAMSEDGRYLAFSSTANNLAPDDTNDVADVFVRDRQQKTTVRISMGLNGKQADRASGEKGLSFSGDGRYVAYTSAASNLVEKDSNFRDDIFLCDVQTGKTRRVSISVKGEQANGISRNPVLTRDGRYLAFTSAADNLVPDDTNESWDIFVSDWQTGKLLRVSTAADGAPADDDSTFPSISADGRYIAFVSAATNLAAGDANGKRDIFLHDLKTRKITRVSVSSTGTEGNGDSTAPVVSADGRYVLFVSAADNLVKGDTNEKPDVFLHDCQTGATVRISTATGGTEANGASGFCTMTPDARYIAFLSDAGNLMAKDTNGEADLFLYDREKGKLRCLSLTATGKSASVTGLTPAISVDGKYLLCVSAAVFTHDDTGKTRDIFLCTPQPATIASK